MTYNYVSISVSSIHRPSVEAILVRETYVTSQSTILAFCMAHGVSGPPPSVDGQRSKSTKDKFSQINCCLVDVDDDRNGVVRWT